MQVLQASNLPFLCCSSLWWSGGGVRPVPVAPCDSHQFAWFDDGQSEPAEQLRLRDPCPPLQPASQSQLTQPVALQPGNTLPVMFKPKIIIGETFHKPNLLYFTEPTLPKRQTTTLYPLPQKAFIQSHPLSLKVDQQLHQNQNQRRSVNDMKQRDRQTLEHL